MITLPQCLATGVPGLIVVEPDVGYWRTMVPAALAALGGGRPLLEWTCIQSWGASIEHPGSKDLFGRSGLANKVAEGVAIEQQAVRDLEQLGKWLVGRIGEAEHLFQGGVAVMHDLTAGEPGSAFIRQLSEALQAATLRGVTIVLTTAAPLAEAHPLRGLMPQVEMERPPAERYGQLAGEFLRQIGVGEEQRGQAEPVVFGHLAGLTLAEASLVLRLVLLEQRQGRVPDWPSLAAALAAQARAVRPGLQRREPPPVE